MLALLMSRPFSSPSRTRRGCPPLGCLHALELPTAPETEIRRHEPPRKASSLSPHMHVPFTAVGSGVQTAH